MLLVVTLALADPAALLRAEGCVACHDLGVGAGVGPPLGVGLGGELEVTQDGASLVIQRDEAYLFRALVNPEADVRVGFPAGVMPAVKEEKARELLPALLALDSTSGGPKGGLLELVAAALAFSLGHLALSAAAVRAPLAKKLGENGFLSVYSLVIGTAFAALVWAWSRAPFVPLWDPAPWTRFVPLVVMPFVAIAQVAGYSTPSPTLAGMDKLLDEPLEPRGILRITRHPVNLSAAVWALAHCFPNGDVANLCLFGSVALLGIAGSVHIDMRRAAAQPEAWARYAAQSSFVPFVALFQRRTTWRFAELGWARLLVGLLTYAGLLAVHGWVIGASPFPTGF